MQPLPPFTHDMPALDGHEGPLMLAMKLNDLVSLRLLLQYGVDVYQETHRGTKHLWFIFVRMKKKVRY